MISNLNDLHSFLAPDMDTNVAVRAILGILAKASTIGGDGSVTVSGSGGFTARSINNVTVAVAGTAVNFPNVACKAVLLVAPSRNTGIVYIGGSGVTKGDGVQTGCQLSPLGMPSQTFNVSNLNQLYINADTAGDSVGIIIFE